MEKGEIISENIQTAEVFNDYFVNIVKDLNIPEISVIASMNPSIIINDPIETIVQNFKEHPSVKIKQHIVKTEMFSFKKINKIQIENEIKELNSRKAPGADGIPANILKETVDILKSPLTQLFNVTVENQHFPNDLKYANVTPLHKKRGKH